MGRGLGSCLGALPLGLSLPDLTSCPAVDLLVSSCTESCLRSGLGPHRVFLALLEQLCPGITSLLRCRLGPACSPALQLGRWPPGEKQALARGLRECEGSADGPRPWLGQSGIWGWVLPWAGCPVTCAPAVAPGAAQRGPGLLLGHPVHPPPAESGARPQPFSSPAPTALSASATGNIAVFLFYLRKAQE